MHENNQCVPGAFKQAGKSGVDRNRVKLSLAQIAEGFRFAGLGCDTGSRVSHCKF